MDFSPGRNKLIASLIVLILVTVSFSYLIAGACVTTEVAYPCTEDNCPDYENPCNPWHPSILAIVAIFFGLPGFVIAYVIYSLFEKKQAPKAR